MGNQGVHEMDIARWGLGVTLPVKNQYCGLIYLGKISYRLGRSLEFDPAKMKFIDDPEADRMLAKQYREPFVFPDIG